MDIGRGRFHTIAGIPTNQFDTLEQNLANRPAQALVVLADYHPVIPATQIYNPVHFQGAQDLLGSIRTARPSYLITMNLVSGRHPL